VGPLWACFLFFFLRFIFWIFSFPGGYFLPLLCVMISGRFARFLFPLHQPSSPLTLFFFFPAGEQNPILLVTGLYVYLFQRSPSLLSYVEAPFCWAIPTHFIAFLLMVVWLVFSLMSPFVFFFFLSFAPSSLA